VVLHNNILLSFRHSDARVTVAESREVLGTSAGGL